MTKKTLDIRHTLHNNITRYRDIDIQYTRSQIFTTACQSEDYRKLTLVSEWPHFPTRLSIINTNGSPELVKLGWYKGRFNMKYRR